MKITENIESLCIHIRSEKEWDRTVKKLRNIGWNSSSRVDATPFIYTSTYPILYIGISTMNTSRLYLSTIEHFKINVNKCYLKISITELNIIIKTGQLLLLLL